MRINGISFSSLILTLVLFIYSSQALAQDEQVPVFLHKGREELKVANYDQALSYYFKAENECQRGQLWLQLATVYREIARLYGRIGEYDKSKKYLSLALELNLKFNGTELDRAKLYNNLGIVEKNQGHYEKAISYYHQGARIKQLAKDSASLAKTYSNIGASFSELNDLDSAIYYEELALLLHERAGNTSGIAGTLNSIGFINRQQKKYSSALVYYKKGIALANESNLPHLQRRLHFYMSKTYLDLGKPDTALLHYMQYAQFNDSILRLEARDKIAEIEALHEVRRLKQEHELVVEKGRVAERDWQIQLLLLGVLAFLTFAIGVMAFIWQRKKTAIAKEKVTLQKEALEKGRKEASQAAHQIFHEINNNLIAMQVNYRLGREEERKIGDQILKDTVKQNTRIANMLWRQENPDNHAED